MAASANLWSTRGISPVISPLISIGISPSSVLTYGQGGCPIQGPGGCGGAEEKKAEEKKPGGAAEKKPGGRRLCLRAGRPGCRGRGGRSRWCGVCATLCVDDSVVPVWNAPTRSRDGAGSPDYDSDTGPVPPDRGRGGVSARTPVPWLVHGTADGLRTRAVTSAVRTRPPFPVLHVLKTEQP